MLQGHEMPEIRKRFENDYSDILLKNWAVWTPVQLANFYFVPIIYRKFTRICITNTLQKRGGAIRNDFFENASQNVSSFVKGHFSEEK